MGSKCAILIQKITCRFVRFNFQFHSSFAETFSTASTRSCRRCLYLIGGGLVQCSYDAVSMVRVVLPLVEIVDVVTI